MVRISIAGAQIRDSGNGDRQREIAVHRKTTDLLADHGRNCGGVAGDSTMHEIGGGNDEMAALDVVRELGPFAFDEWRSEPRIEVSVGHGGGIAVGPGAAVRKR